MRNTKNSKAVEVNNDFAKFEITGTLSGVFEGKNKNYITVKVNGDEINPKTKQPYYSTYNIGVDKSIELFDDDTPVTVTGTVKSYFDKEQQRTAIYLNAENVLMNV